MCTYDPYLSDGVPPIRVYVLEDVKLRFGDDLYVDLEVVVLEGRGRELLGYFRLRVHLIPVMRILHLNLAFV